ncbi:2-C-methyl-D-erythritol 4-phosphate cytidylyltransferase [Aliidiomarina sp. Khilg15.8]
MQTPSFIGILPAAGIGARMDSSVPKQYLHIAGRTILEHSLSALLQDPRIEHIVVALHPEDTHFSDLPLAQDPRVHTVTGGATRAESVLLALRSLPVVTDQLVVVHDAARPCLREQDLEAVMNAAVQSPQQGAILATPVRDTMKRGSTQGIEATVSRENLWHALTPQVFSLELLRHNLQAALDAGTEITDEASAMEWAGLQPQLISGAADNIKVTRPDDLVWAEWWLQRQAR